MSEISWLWTTSTSGDGTANGYTENDTSAFCKILAACSGFEGVAPNYLNGLAVTGTTSPVSVATGGAMVDGKPYLNNASTTVVIPTPSVSTRIDRIVLRADWASYTVRITRIAGDEGGAAPAITQTPGTTYDIKLARVSITTGEVITVTDERTWAIMASGGGTIYRQGGSAVQWSSPGSSNYNEATWKECCGSIQWSGSDTSGTVVVTLPITYKDYPIAFCNLVAGGPVISIVAYINSYATNSITIAWKDIDATTRTLLTFFWMALGPQT